MWYLVVKVETIIAQSKAPCQGVGQTPCKRGPKSPRVSDTNLLENLLDGEVVLENHLVIPVTDSKTVQVFGGGPRGGVSTGGPVNGIDDHVS